jgi:hypothetical protein
MFIARLSIASAPNDKAVSFPLVLARWLNGLRQCHESPFSRSPMHRSAAFHVCQQRDQCNDAEELSHEDSMSKSTSVAMSRGVFYRWTTARLTSTLLAHFGKLKECWALGNLKRWIHRKYGGAGATVVGSSIRCRKRTTLYDTLESHSANQGFPTPQ